jgi:hypothetical protein
MVTIEQISERIMENNKYDFKSCKEGLIPLTTDDYVLPRFYIKESKATFSKHTSKFLSYPAQNRAQ